MKKAWKPAALRGFHGKATIGRYALLLPLLLAGCAAPQTKMGPPPSPILSTRPPKVVPAQPRPAPARPEPAPSAGVSLRGATIVVDPGHGGHDPGAQGRSSIPEKTINLDVGRRLAQILESEGANVTLSRSGDRFVELDGRAALAERTRTDLFVSIHADSARRSSAIGMTVYVGRNASSNSRRAAQCISQALESAGLEVRGVQSAGYRVLVGHSRPAVLVECGFLTNEREARQLGNPEYRARIAEAIAAGIANYFR